MWIINQSWPLPSITLTLNRNKDNSLCLPPSWTWIYEDKRPQLRWKSTNIDGRYNKYRFLLFYMVIIVDSYSVPTPVSFMACWARWDTISWKHVLAYLFHCFLLGITFNSVSHILRSVFTICWARKDTSGTLNTCCGLFTYSVHVTEANQLLSFPIT